MIDSNDNEGIIDLSAIARGTNSYSKAEQEVRYYGESVRAEEDTSQYSPILKIEPTDRLSSAIKILFEKFKRETDKGFCVSLLNRRTDEYVDEWFPKKLCSNLDFAEQTFYCWEVFMAAAKPHLLADSDRPEFELKARD